MDEGPGDRHRAPLRSRFDRCLPEDRASARDRVLRDDPATRRRRIARVRHRNRHVARATAVAPRITVIDAARTTSDDDDTDDRADRLANAAKTATSRSATNAAAPRVTRRRRSANRRRSRRDRNLRRRVDRRSWSFFGRLWFRYVHRALRERVRSLRHLGLVGGDLLRYRTTHTASPHRGARPWRLDGRDDSRPL